MKLIFVLFFLSFILVSFSLETKSIKKSQIENGIEYFFCKDKKIIYEPECDPKDDCCDSKCLRKPEGTPCNSENDGTISFCNSLNSQCGEKKKKIETGNYIGKMILI